jgi:hypothetical protein
VLIWPMVTRIWFELDLNLGRAKLQIKRPITAN